MRIVPPSSRSSLRSSARRSRAERPPSNFSGTGGSGYADGPAADSCPANCEANAAGMYLPRSILIGATTRYVAHTVSGDSASRKNTSAWPRGRSGSPARNVSIPQNCKLRPAHVPLFLSDTLSATRKPVPEGPIKLYVCGVTPYDTTHLGHAFTFVQFDTLVRALRWLHPDREVIYVQNVTDIDDSILMRARKLGVGWRTLGDEQTELYRADMRALNVADPTHL